MGQSPLCVCSKPKPIPPKQTSQKEILFLELIYEDLASRSKSKTIGHQIFHLYFHKKGFWSDYIFRSLQGSSQGISKENFIMGITHFFKIDEAGRIKKLYDFLVRDEEDPNKGISYKTLLSILYNYPREDLETILDDPLFLSHYLGKGFKQDSLKTILDRKTSKTEEVPSSATRKKISEFEIHSSDSDNSKCSAQGYLGIMQEVKQRRKVCQFEGTLENRKIKIIYGNLNSLARKFARKIFKDYRLQPETGRLRFAEFADLLSQHHNIYKNYYDGFHTELWKYTNTSDSHHPCYLDEKLIMQSKACWKNNEIYLILIGSTLFVNSIQESEIPLAIINLQGLIVQQINKKEKHGFAIAHKDNHYEKKEFYFDLEYIRNEWMSKLKNYKGIDVHEKYIFKSRIGAGRFSIVYSGIRREDGAKVAIKDIDNSKLSKSQLNALLYETEIMQYFDNPYLIKHIETIQTKMNTYIVTELVDNGVELNEYIEKMGRQITQNEAAQIIYQIIVATLDIHRKGFIHRDLKPQNVLVISNPETSQIPKIKIIDFGFAISIKECQFLNSQERVEPVMGSIGYIAPEQFLSGELSEKIDSFSIGGIIYSIFTKALPFTGFDSPIEVYVHNTIEGELFFNPRVWDTLSKDLKNLVNQLTAALPEERLSLSQALTHSWFKNILPSFV